MFGVTAEKAIAYRNASSSVQHNVDLA